MILGISSLLMGVGPSAMPLWVDWLHRARMTIGIYHSLSFHHSRHSYFFPQFQFPQCQFVSWRCQQKHGNTEHPETDIPWAIRVMVVSIQISKHSWWGCLRSLQTFYKQITLTKHVTKLGPRLTLLPDMLKSVSWRKHTHTHAPGKTPTALRWDTMQTIYVFYAVNCIHHHNRT